MHSAHFVPFQPDNGHETLVACGTCFSCQVAGLTSSVYFQAALAVWIAIQRFMGDAPHAPAPPPDKHKVRTI